MVKYRCPRCGSGDDLEMLYARRYREGDRSGSFVPMVVKGLRLASCGRCDRIVPAARGGGRVRRGVKEGGRH